MALKGLVIEYSDSPPLKVIGGLKGLIIETNLNLSVKVTDRRGLGLSNVKVVISNPTSGVPFTAFTDSNGNVLVNKDTSNPNTITASKENVFTSVSYTGSNSVTIILDPPLLR